MAIQGIDAASGRPLADNSQSTYGSGLGGMGGIYQYGHAMPFGPYTGLPQRRPGQSPPIMGGGSTDSAEKWMNDVLAGKNLPFSPEQQAAQLTQQSDMNAAGESARNQNMMANAAAGGASANDPSMQGAKAANFARRQTDNTRAAGDIASRASSANFGAQMQAAGQLNNNQMQRQSWQQNTNSQAMNFMPWNRGGSSGGTFNNFNYGQGLRPGPVFSL